MWVATSGLLDTNRWKLQLFQISSIKDSFHNKRYAYQGEELISVILVQHAELDVSIFVVQHLALIAGHIGCCLMHIFDWFLIGFNAVILAIFC